MPARLESSRLPNKVILDIGGKPMIQRVIEICKEASNTMKVVLCTDNKKLEELAIKLNIPILYTSKECNSGSERISTVIEKLVGIAWGEELKYLNLEKRKSFISQTGIINVQGDQPFLDPLNLLKMEKFLKETTPVPEVVTPIYKLKPESIHNPAVVKTLVDRCGRAIYFSRSAIPHVRDIPKSSWHIHTNYWGHIGIYGYRGDILATWNNMANSKLEKLEKLEQLRIIDAGFKISTFLSEQDSLSIDTFEQLEEARKIIKNKTL